MDKQNTEQFVKEASGKAGSNNSDNLTSTSDMLNDLEKILISEGDSNNSDNQDTTDEMLENFKKMLVSDGESPTKAHDWVAHLPSSICENKNFSGPLFGIVREETESIYVLAYPKYENDEHFIGYIDNGTFVSQKNFNAYFDNAKRNKIFGFYENGLLVLKILKNCDNIKSAQELHDALASGSDTAEIACCPVRIKQYDAVTNLFSRNTGLLESSDMLDKTAFLVGCGSVGSFVAMELARSGVGRFVLCDTDTLEIHNICRHQCGFEDLGRYKTDAVKDRILNINPNADVVTFRSIIQEIPEQELLPLLGRNTIIIGGGDNRGSADYACRLAIKTDSTFVASCCWTRAFAGEIFYWMSGKNLSCYTCAFKDLIDSGRPESHNTYFGSEEEKNSLSFEPGVAVDIDFVTIIAVKLALDLLNRDNSNYTPRVVNYLRQYTWVCNTNNTNIGGQRAGIFSYPLQITHNLKVHKDENCPYCCGK